MPGENQIEKLIILDAGNTPSLDEVEFKLSENKGRLIHCYSPRCMVITYPQEEESALGASFPGSSLDPSKSKSVFASDAPDYTENEALAMNAWNLRQSTEYADAKANRPNEGDEWSNPSSGTPMNCTDLAMEEDEEQVKARSLSFAMAEPTSARMTGRIAVGIIMVEGPDENLKFSEAERAKAIAEAQDGLGWLARQSPEAQIRWFYDIKFVSIDTPPGPNTLSFGQKEALWRDPAMIAIGYPSGFNGVRQYVEDLRQDMHTDWTFCAYFTKYPLGWFAYASIGGPRFVMSYFNDGWGVNNIDRVFAHETGHIFGAPDEYSSSGCNCGGRWGFYKVPNANCENCAPNRGVACIMKRNSYELCKYTPRHFGFPQPPAQQVAGIMNVHGNKLEITFPRRIVSLWRSPGFTRVTGKPFTTNWASIPVPTPVSDDESDTAVAAYVSVRFRSSSRKTRLFSIRVFDGERKIAAYDNYYLSFDTWNTIRFPIPGQPRIELGLTIQIGMRFEGDDERDNCIDVSSAGFDFGD